MKLLSALVLSLASLSLASDLSARQGPRQKKPAARPARFTGTPQVGAQAARRPAGAPADYKTGTAQATLMTSKDGLTRLPPELIGKRDRYMAMARVRSVLMRQSTANDFYECKRQVCGVLLESLMVEKVRMGCARSE